MGMGHGYSHVHFLDYFLLVLICSTVQERGPMPLVIRTVGCLSTAWEKKYWIGIATNLQSTWTYWDFIMSITIGHWENVFMSSDRKLLYSADYALKKKKKKKSWNTSRIQYSFNNNKIIHYDLYVNCSTCKLS